jgi:hypothetical protein
MRMECVLNCDVLYENHNYHNCEVVSISCCNIHDELNIMKKQDGPWEFLFEISPLMFHISFSFHLSSLLFTLIYGNFSFRTCNHTMRPEGIPQQGL